MLLAWVSSALQRAGGECLVLGEETEGQSCSGSIGLADASGRGMDCAADLGAFVEEEPSACGSARGENTGSMPLGVTHGSRLGEVHAGRLVAIHVGISRGCLTELVAPLQFTCIERVIGRVIEVGV